MIIVSLVLSSEDHFPWPDLRLRHNPLGHDAGLRGLRDARRRHDPTGPLRHRDLCFLSVSKITRRSELRRAQVSMFYGCISAKATTCANTYGELAVPLKKKRE